TGCGSPRTQCTRWWPRPTRPPGCRRPNPIEPVGAGMETETMTEQQVRTKSFPVSWDQFHRDSRALAWRLQGEGPFEACIAITRGGLVPAAIVSRELNIRIVESVSVKSYDHQSQAVPKVTKPISADIIALAKAGKKMLIVDDLVDTGATARVVRKMLP